VLHFLLRFELNSDLLSNYLSISSGAQYHTLPCTNISHPQVFFSPATPPIKPKLELQRGRTQETTNSSPPRPIKLSSQSTGVKLCCACLPASASCATTMQGQNHFAEPKWHVLTFLHPIIVWRVHFLLYLWIGCFVPPSSLWALCSKSPTPG